MKLFNIIEVKQAKVFIYKATSIMVRVNNLVLCPGDVYSLGLIIVYCPKFRLLIKDNYIGSRDRVIPC